MRCLWQLLAGLPDGRDLHRSVDQPGAHQCGRMRGMLYLLPRHVEGAPQSRHSCERSARTAQFFRFRFDPEPDICPTDAIVPEELSWPRVVRRAFSDPQVPHESTGIHGRGTAEVKTNDVTGRVKEGEAGFVSRVRPAGSRRALSRHRAGHPSPRRAGRRI